MYTERGVSGFEDGGLTEVDSWDDGFPPVTEEQISQIRFARRFTFVASLFLRSSAALILGSKVFWSPLNGLYFENYARSFPREPQLQFTAAGFCVNPCWLTS